MKKSTSPVRARRGAFLYTGLVLVVVLTRTPAPAQQSLGVDPTGRSGERRPRLLGGTTLYILHRNGFYLRLHLRQQEKPNTYPLRMSSCVKFALPAIRLSPRKNWLSVTAPYTNRELTSEDLEALRLALTHYYINKGYINSGAIIPDQTVTDGVVTLRIIEGELSQIEVTGNTHLRASYIQNRVALDAGPPVNLNALQRRLQLLQQDPLIERLNAELSPGVGPGDSILHVRVDERRPYSVWIGFNNYQSPTVGAERGLISLAHQNLTGYGDSLSVTYGGSEGVNPQLDAYYTFP